MRYQDSGIRPVSLRVHDERTRKNSKKGNAQREDEDVFFPSHDSGYRRLREKGREEKDVEKLFSSPFEAKTSLRRF